MAITTTIIEGQQVKLGDIVGFKSDVEQAGKLIAIKGRTLILEALSDDGFSGDYIGGDETTQVDREDCW